MNLMRKDHNENKFVQTRPISDLVIYVYNIDTVEIVRTR